MTDNAKKRWVFTLNNYTAEEYHDICHNLSSNDVLYAVVGREVGDNGTPHLQGFVYLKRKVRLRGLKTVLGNFRVHGEGAKGSDYDNTQYCTKQDKQAFFCGQSTPNLTERGGRNTSAMSTLHCVRHLADTSATTAILENPELLNTFCRCKSAIERLATDARRHNESQRMLTKCTTVYLKRFQRDILELVKGEPHPRQVHWFYDEVGNSGKTWLSRYLVSTVKALRVENAKSADVKFAYKGERVVIFDLSRSQSEKINYEIIETIKNGIMFSTKYDSGMKMFNVPHVLVFSNSLPDQSKLSADRWDIRIIDDVAKEQSNTPYCHEQPTKEINFDDLLRQYAYLQEPENPYTQSQTDNPQSQADNPQSQPDNLQSQPDNLQSQPYNLLSQLDNLQSQPDNLQSQPYNLQSQPDNPYTQSQLDYSQSQPDNTQSQLDYSQSQLDYLQSQPDNTQSQLDYPQSQPDNTQSQLDYTQSQLNYPYTQSQLDYTQADSQEEHSEEHSQEDNSEDD